MAARFLWVTLPVSENSLTLTPDCDPNKPRTLSTNMGRYSILSAVQLHDNTNVTDLWYRCSICLRRSDVANPLLE